MDTPSTPATVIFPQPRKRALIADAHASARDLLEIALTLEGSCKVIGHTGLGAGVLEMCRADEPEILILDPKLPDIAGGDIVRRVRKEHRHVRILIYSGMSSREIILDVLEARPHGFVHKEEPLNVFYDVLHAVVAGSRYFSEYGMRLLEQAHDPKRLAKSALAPREKEVLTLLAHGRSSKEIAGDLHIAPKTVDHHRATMMAKLGIHEVASLTRYAVSMGMVSLDE